MSITDSLLILCNAPRLIFCKISRIVRFQGEPSIVILPSLRSLRLITTYFNVLNNLITPCLEDLVLSTHYNVLMEVITSFFKRSACSLRSFSIFVVEPVNFEGYISLLQLIPSLKTLTITSDNLYAGESYPGNILQLVAKVVSSQSKRGLLPNLEVLKYTGELHLGPGYYAGLDPLPPADNAVHGPLRSLKLDLYPATRIPKKIISYLLSLEERGVTVNVLSSSENILQSSIDYYRGKEESLRRDWVDNLESNLMQDLQPRYSDK